MNKYSKSIILTLALTLGAANLTGCSMAKAEEAPIKKEAPIAKVELKNNKETDKKEKNKNEVEKQEKKTVGKIEFTDEYIDFSNLTYEMSNQNRNEALEKAINKSIGYNKEQDGLVRYFYNEVDLNDDGKNEIFVMLLGQAVSGSGGSTAYIYEDVNGDLQEKQRFTLVNNPIIISNETTNGWHDIILRVAGGGAQPFFTALKYDGNQYPSNPSVEPALASETIVEGTAIIADDIVFGYGLELQ